MTGHLLGRVRWLLIGAAGLVTADVAVHVVSAVRDEASSFAPHSLPVRVPRALEALPRHDVAFTGKDGAVIRGWYFPSRNRAAVILGHGSGADRSQMATETLLLSGDGFGVLAFDWPGHGESGGKITCGADERAALRAAVAFVASQPDVDPGRIGALGFSIGAAFVAVTAPDEARLRSIALLSCFADSDEQTGRQFGAWSPIMGWPAVLVDHHYMPGGPLRPVDAVRRLGGRDLLVLAAAGDGVVPPWMSQEVYQAATGPKEWVLLPHGGHGGLDATAPGPYRDALLRFFRRTLSPGDVASPADGHEAPPEHEASAHP